MAVEASVVSRNEAGVGWVGWDQHTDRASFRVSGRGDKARAWEEAQADSV